MQKDLYSIGFILGMVLPIIPIFFANNKLYSGFVFLLSSFILTVLFFGITSIEPKQMSLGLFHGSLVDFIIAFFAIWILAMSN